LAELSDAAVEEYFNSRGGSLHPHHLLSQGGGYGRPAQRFVNPMKGRYGNAW
jgi:hypothetical protein